MARFHRETCRLRANICLSDTPNWNYQKAKMIISFLMTMSAYQFVYTCILSVISGFGGITLWGRV